MLMAQPGWESKFTAAALEEAGWHVDGSYRVSPRTSVTLGAPARLDTARYAVVLLLDSMSVDAVGITRFVQQGGGLVLSGDALRIPALASISPVRATSGRGAVAGALLTETPQRGLDAWELVANRGTSVVQSDPSDHGHAEPVLVAQRIEGFRRHVERFFPCGFAKDRRPIGCIAVELPNQLWVFGHARFANQRHRQPLWVVDVVKPETAFHTQTAVVGRAIAPVDADDVVVLHVVGQQATHAAKWAHRVDFFVDCL